MKKILFISERSIKDSSIIEQNTDSKIVRLTVAEVQDLELLPILGKTLYSELEEEIVKKSEDSSYEIPDNYLDMLDIIKPFLIYGTLTYIAVPLTYKATNKGLAVKNDTNASVTDGSDLQYVINYYSKKFDAYKNRLIDEFGKYCSTDFMTKDLGYSTGMYIQNNQKRRERLERVAYKY